MECTDSESEDNDKEKQPKSESQVWFQIYLLVTAALLAQCVCVPAESSVVTSIRLSLECT